MIDTDFRTAQWAGYGIYGMDLLSCLHVAVFQPVFLQFVLVVVQGWIMDGIVL